MWFSLQVMKKSHEARMKLLRLGIFKEVEVLIDISEGIICVYYHLNVSINTDDYLARSQTTFNNMLAYESNAVWGDLQCVVYITAIYQP